MRAGRVQRRPPDVHSAFNGVAEVPVTLAGASRAMYADGVQHMRANGHQQRRNDRIGDQRDDQSWFSRGARYWLDVYHERGLAGQIYRRRLWRSIAWVDEIENPSDFTVLDAGCGAGDLTVELARRGARVVASDLSVEMTEMTDARVRIEALDARVVRADAHRLPFPEGAFHLVVALGLLPWVRSPQLTLDELARVTRPGGHLIVSFDNAVRLFRVTDPRLSPLTAPVRSVVRRLRGRSVRGNLLSTPRRGREMVTSAGLQVSRTASVGFGPPTFLAHQLVPESLAMSIDTALQRRADEGAHWLAGLGVHYLVLGRR